MRLRRGVRNLGHPRRPSHTEAKRNPEERRRRAKRQRRRPTSCEGTQLIRACVCLLLPAECTVVAHSQSPPSVVCSLSRLSSVRHAAQLVHARCTGAIQRTRRKVGHTNHRTDERRSLVVGLQARGAGICTWGGGRPGKSAGASASGSINAGECSTALSCVCGYMCRRFSALCVCAGRASWRSARRTFVQRRVRAM
jgi:hypothetical protein